MRLRFYRTSLLGLSVLVASALALSACASSGSNGSSNNANQGSAQNTDSSGAPKLSGSITVTEAGGSFGNFVKTKVVKPFADKTGVKVNTVTGLTMENLAKMRASKDNPELDVVSFDPPGAYPAAKEGLLMKLDAAKLPNIKKLNDWAVVKDDQLVGVLASNQCIAYNTQYVKNPPTSWEDLWKPEYKGKVVLPDISTSHGMYLVMMMSKLATGNDLYNAGKAFEKLATLKSNVLTYYTSHDQMAQLLNSGQAWIGSWTADRAITQQNQGAPIDCIIPKEGAVFFTSYAGIAKGTKNPDAAYAFLDSWISADSQTAAANEIFLGPTNKEAKLEGKPLKYLDPNRSGLIRPDWDKLIQLGPEWTDTWNKTMK
jgi:putative spermidine/putrescine transport system substrate-binding protein